MSQWGKLDSKQLTGNVRVVNGSATVANAAGNTTVFLLEVKPGDYFAAGPLTANSNVKYYVTAVTSNTSLTLSTAYQGSSANVKANVQQGPKDIYWTQNDTSNLYSIQRVIGVDYVEANVGGNKANNISQPGWSHMTVYTDGYGQRRVKTEVLVAMSKYFNRDVTTGNLYTDANDNTFARNS